MQKRKWTNEEIEFVKDNFLTMTKKEIAEKINRTWKSVVHRCEILGLEYPEPKIGDKFNRLEIKNIKMGRKVNQQASIATCECDCGIVKDYLLTCVVNGKTKSCGCLRNEKGILKGKILHNLTHHPLYSRWTGMKQRCADPNSIGYHNYGGKGINVCEEWKNNFQAFYDWAMNNGWREDLTIDRKENNLGYSPENCRWVSMEEQQSNRSNNKILTAFGETKNLSSWARDDRCISKNIHLINDRLKLGWEVEKAIITPARKLNNFEIEYLGESKGLNEWLKDDRCKIKNYRTIYMRIFNYHWSIEKAFNTE